MALGNTSSMSVDILIGTDVVGTTTTRADGSWSCDVPIALGQQTFVARAGGETSDPYTLTALPPQAITDDFDDLPEGDFSYADRDFLSINVTGSRVIIAHSFNNHPPFLDDGKIYIIADHNIETRVSFKPKKLTRRVRYGFAEELSTEPSVASIIYHYNTGEQVTAPPQKAPCGSSTKPQKTGISQR